MRSYRRVCGILSVNLFLTLGAFGQAPASIHPEKTAAAPNKTEVSGGAKKDKKKASPPAKGDDKKTQDKPEPSPPAKPSVTEGFSYSLPGGTGATQAAGILNDLSIVGLGQVVATGDAELVFLLDRQAVLKSLSKKPADNGNGAIEDLKARLEKIATALAKLAPTKSTVIGLPEGAVASDFAISALKISGISSATAIGGSDVLITYNPANTDSRSFVEKLEQPLPPDKRVESATERLYYVSGTEAATAVAMVVNNMYPDVAAAFVPPDMIQLSMKTLPDGTKRHQTDTIDDARRTIARIDQPRPRASLDVWAVQIATEEPKSLEFVTPKIEELTSAYNEAMSRSLIAGWSYLTTNANLDARLKSYISGVSISKNHRCCYVGETRQDAIASSQPGYGLGYQTLLNPVTPNLIDILVNIVAHNDPRKTAIGVMDAMEGPLKTSAANPDPDLCSSDCSRKATAISKSASQSDGTWCRQRDVLAYQAWKTEQQAPTKCEHGCSKKVGIVVPPHLALSCVRRELESHLLAAATNNETPNTSAIGQMRAAIVDFLYQYKLMALYPTDFHAYLEPMSADTLDMALLPLVDAFYDDLGVFQETMEEQVYALLTAKKISYSASGLISMKMIAGTRGIVNSTSQNSFQMSQASSAADVSDAIASIKTDPTSAASKLIKLMTPTSVTASLGKELNLTSTVHSLSGAYGMELDLLIDSAESGTPQLVTSGAATTKTDDLNSRVTTHHLQTKVRVDSLKLFEVSTARSLVARGQAPWVPLDPYFEVPVLSQLVRKPRKPKSVHTQSLLFANALVVPTAIDLGYGNPITPDATLVPGEGTQVRTLQEAGDLTGLASDSSRFLIEDYHAQTVSCLASQYIDAGGKVSGCANPPLWSETLRTLPNHESASDVNVPVSK
jgi:hypothetical protein